MTRKHKGKGNEEKGEMGRDGDEKEGGSDLGLSLSLSPTWGLERHLSENIRKIVPPLTPLPSSPPPLYITTTITTFITTTSPPPLIYISLGVAHRFTGSL